MLPILMSERYLLSQEYLKRKPLEASKYLETYNVNTLVKYFKVSDPNISWKVLRYFPLILISPILERINKKKAVLILQRLPEENSLIVLQYIQPQQRNQILKLLPSNYIEAIKAKQKYLEGTAGYFMNPNQMVLPIDYTVRQAVEAIKQNSTFLMYYIFVVDRNGVLKGFVHSKQLLIFPSETKLKELIHLFKETISPYTTYKQILDSKGWLQHHALPVVNQNNVFLGAINYQNFKKIERLSEKIGDSTNTEGYQKRADDMVNIGFINIIRGMFNGLFYNK